MFGNNFAFGANLGYEFKRGLLVYINVNRALRLPTFTDLYYKSATQQSNPNLKPEQSLTAEIGLKINHKGFYANLTAFYRSGRDIIDWIKFHSDSTVWHSMNYTKINTLGGELSIGYQWNKWIKTVDLSYSYIDSDKKMDGFLSLYALDYLKHKITAKLEHKIYKNFGATWQYSFQVRNNSNGALTDYKPFGLFDGRIYWHNAHLNVFLDANNILDTKYHDISGVEQPGRWVKCGVGYLF
jgi:iron complex outermembrane receptor protein